MRCGLFGKLPAKRDFVAVSVPRAFLQVWEPWLEHGLAAGRASGADGEWAAAFNSAPIWRFWLAPGLCGEAVAGALMPSVDALGRMFPLTLIAVADCVEQLAPPDVDPRDAWFAEVEDFLLDALDAETAFETTVARLNSLCAGAPTAGSRPNSQAFAALRAEQPEHSPDIATFWWTIGGADWPPLAIMRHRMPTPAIFADMLRRRKSVEPDAAKQKTSETAQPG